MNVHRFTGAFASIAALAVSACAITSDGLELSPEAEAGQPFVTADWRSSDDLSGTMTVSVSDGRVFTGPYVWITAETQAALLEPLWQGWSADHGWRHWQPGPDFVNHYRGEILASLHAANGERLRCRFRSLNRASGMSGGGHSACQFSDGSTFDASFAPARPS